jgi:hypothetical protein
MRMPACQLLLPHQCRRRSTPPQLLDQWLKFTLLAQGLATRKFPQERGWRACPAGDGPRALETRAPRRRSVYYPIMFHCSFCQFSNPNGFVL